MRNFALCVAFFSILISVSSSVNAEGTGGCAFGKETILDPLCYGPTTLAETTVTGKMSVAGQLDAQNSSMGTVEVAGVANMDGSNVKGDTHLMGPMTANRSIFGGDLSIDSDKMTLSASIVKGSITVKSAQAGPVLELTCGTTVVGGINFQGQPGIIKKTGDVLIEGRITNGTIEPIMSDKKCDRVPDEDDEEDGEE